MSLTSCNNVNKYNVIFEEATTNKHGHQRINIQAKHACGENAPGPLLILSPLRFSFGVQGSLNKTGDITGYSIPVSLWDSYEDQPTQKEFDFYAALKALKHLCRDHLEEVYGEELAGMMKFPMVEKEGKPPILYTKLMYSEKTQRIHTLFHSKEKSKENPLDYLDQYIKVKMAILVDSIYISDNTVSAQLKLHDVFVRPLPQRMALVTISEDELEEDEDELEDEELLSRRGEDQRAQGSIQTLSQEVVVRKDGLQELQTQESPLQPGE
ncbi:hypothetical protein AWC38_SpisGene12151 [Stylophora pistillata]|uniref:Uncharacterized protein n=1 Tax=Stylophora pistillata TaxID=50429 RepID=A0A2B4S419_STYPI|nr:hypothetical protein AWC38_SpisGene12151 [Stylophora pistillata]